MSSLLWSGVWVSSIISISANDFFSFSSSVCCCVFRSFHFTYLSFILLLLDTFYLNIAFFSDMFLFSSLMVIFWNMDMWYIILWLLFFVVLVLSSVCVCFVFQKMKTRRKNNNKRFHWVSSNRRWSIHTDPSTRS